MTVPLPPVHIVGAHHTTLWRGNLGKWLAIRTAEISTGTSLTLAKGQNR